MEHDKFSQNGFNAKPLSQNEQPAFIQHFLDNLSMKVHLNKMHQIINYCTAVQYRFMCIFNCCKKDQKKARKSVL